MPKQPMARVRAMSGRRKRELSRYAELRDEFLKKHPLCDREGCSKKSTEVHHTRGRFGVLLNHVEYWVALCPDCHRWVHNFPESAKAEGLFGPWGRTPRDEETIARRNSLR